MCIFRSFLLSGVQTLSFSGASFCASGCAFRGAEIHFMVPCCCSECEIFVFRCCCWLSGVQKCSIPSALLVLLIVLFGQPKLPFSVIVRCLLACCAKCRNGHVPAVFSTVLGAKMVISRCFLCASDCAFRGAKRCAIVVPLFGCYRT